MQRIIAVFQSHHQSMIDSITNQLLVIIASNLNFVLKFDLPISISIYFALSNYWYSAILLIKFLYYLTVLLRFIKAIILISWNPLLYSISAMIIMIDLIIVILPFPMIKFLRLIIISLFIIPPITPIISYLLIRILQWFILSIFPHLFIWNLRTTQYNLYHFDTQSR